MVTARNKSRAASGDYIQGTRPWRTTERIDLLDLKRLANARPDFMAKSNCANNPGGPYEDFVTTDRADIVRLKREYCTGCPVVRECLDYAIANSMDGVWGGTSRHERNKIKAKRLPPVVPTELPDALKDAAVEQQILALLVVGHTQFTVTQLCHVSLAKVQRTAASWRRGEIK